MANEWSEPWYRLEDERQRCLLEEELKKELAEGHPLAGLPVEVLARRDDRDDVLVGLDSGENGRIAEVHLTCRAKGRPIRVGQEPQYLDRLESGVSSRWARERNR